MTDNSLQQPDIERIYHDVITTAAVSVSLLRIDRIETGWRITTKDRGDRLISLDVPSGPAAVVRAVLRRWTANQEEDADAVVLYP